MRFFKSMAAMAVSYGVLIFGVGANAATISVNYDTASGSTPAITANQVLGVIPVANWNNVVNRNHSIEFLNDSGAATSLAVSVSSGGAWDSWNRSIDPVGGRVFSDKMTMGSVGTINLTTVPYAFYDVYVYMSDWGSEIVNFSLNGGATTVATLSNTTSGRDSGWNGVYVLNDNYVKLSGLSGNQSIRMSATSGEVHVGGFQVVQIPEPGAALLGGLGILALLRRRRA